MTGVSYDRLSGRQDRMKTYSVALLAVALMAGSTAAGATGVAARSQATTLGTVTIPVIAGGYRITLMIGPREAMYTQAEARRTHPKTGEIMLRGSMMMGGMGMGMAMPNRHLEVHVLDRRTMRPASNPMVSITYQALSPMMMRPVSVPVAVMVGLSMDMSDIHYGNNVSMAGGTYRVSVHVNRAYATYAVRL